MNTYIETDRLIIRELLLEHAPGMFEMDSDPEVHQFVGRKPVQSIDEVLAVIKYVRNQYADYGIGRWAIVEKETNEFVGWTGYKMMTEPVNEHVNFYDFGYRLTRKKWRKGLGYEAALASLEYGIEKYGFKDIYAMTDVHNTASRRILEKLGFACKGVFQYDATPTWREPAELTTWYQFEGLNSRQE